MRLVVWVVVVVCALAHHAGAAPLNVVVGDAGWAGRVAPDAPDADRIAAHLAYVETALRDASRGYPADVQARRLRILDRLAAYREARQFPHNTYAPGRVPVFVDAGGRRCAVGALAEYDLGADAIERIGAAHRLALLPAIDDPALAAWIAASGFTLRELTMIQPTYDHEKRIKPTREQLEGMAVSVALNGAERLCEIDLFTKVASLPAHTMAIDTKSAAITWTSDGTVPDAWKTCVAAYVKKTLPTKQLKKATQKLTAPGFPALVTGTPPVLNTGRALGYMQARLERALAACKLPKAPEYDEYRVELDFETNGTVNVTSMGGMPDPGFECAEAEIRAWKFSVGPAKRDHWNLGVQPVSVAERLAEVVQWGKQNLK